MSTPEERQRAAESLARFAVSLQSAFQPLQRAFLNMGDAIGKAFAFMGELERLEAERVAQEERERQALMTNVTFWTWRVVDVIVGVVIGWWLWP